MTHLFKRLTVALLAAIVLSTAAPAGYATAAQVPMTGDKTVVVRVDGKDITTEDVEIAVNNLMPMVSFHSFVSERRLKAIQKKALNQLIENELVLKEAKRLKQDKVDQKAVDEEIEKLKKRVPEGQSLDDVLERSGMTEKDLREELSAGLIVVEYNKKKTEEFRTRAEETVTDEYLKDYYEKNLDKFKEPEQIHMRSILLKADPSGGTRVWNEVKRKAREITEKARGGEDFAELARKHSEDPNAENGGDMGWAHRGSFFEEIDMVASNMKVGEVSEPVMTIYGYHILKLEGIKPAVQRKFSEINLEKLRSELKAKEFKRLRKEWVDGMKKEAKIEYLSELYK